VADSTRQFSGARGACCCFPTSPSPDPVSAPSIPHFRALVQVPCAHLYANIRFRVGLLLHTIRSLASLVPPFPRLSVRHSPAANSQSTSRTMAETSHETQPSCCTGCSVRGCFVCARVTSIGVSPPRWLTGLQGLQSTRWRRLHRAVPPPAVGAGGGYGKTVAKRRRRRRAQQRRQLPRASTRASTSGIDVGHRRGSVAPAAALVGASAVVSSW
jgi:hypothetical protein